MQLKSKLMDELTVQRVLRRMAHEIIEKNKGVDGICLVGIKRRGEQLAALISDNIGSIEGITPPCGSLDIKFYRDDLTTVEELPVLSTPELPFEVSGKKIIIVDDVLFTGRTMRAAIEGIFALGRPMSIQLAILIDRGHRELPFRADYVGKNIPTSLSEAVAVELPPYEESFGVYLYDR